MTTKVFAIRTHHLEHVIAATIWEDRFLSLPARHLGLLLSTWGHRSVINPTDARLLALLGFSDSRLSDARLELTMESSCFDIDRDLVTGAWSYRMTLGDLGKVEFPPTWNTSPEAMGDYVRLYTTRAGLKKAGRYSALPSDQAITLAVLSASLDFAQPQRWATWTPWHAEALRGIAVKEAVSALVDAGYVETQPGSKWRFTSAYAQAVAEIHQLQGTASRKARAEDRFEERWTAKHGGAVEWVSTGDALVTRYIYALRMPSGTPTTIAGVEGVWAPGDIAYLGMTTNPERRLQDHSSVRGQENNPALRAIKDALLMTVDPTTGESLRFEMEILEVLPNCNLRFAALREKALIEAHWAGSHKVVNIQHVSLHFLAA